MKILAIETSCDETAISVLNISGSLSKPNFSVLSNVVSSQIEIHAPFGGVVPSLAKREHQRNLTQILTESLKDAKLYELRGKNAEIKIAPEKEKELNFILEREIELFEQFKKSVASIKPPKIDLIAVTKGPGLEPALWVGVNFARALSYFWNKPLIGANHIEGHILANWLTLTGKKPKIIFPGLCLVVSGGHTQLVLMKNFGKYKVIGETRDDAAGEAFDKVAKMLGLGYPGGPIIAAEAAKFFAKGEFSLRGKIKLPRPMMVSDNFDFSFSGLKTAVLYLLKELVKKNSLKDLAPAFAYEFQEAVMDVLISKTVRAAKKYKVKTVMLGGGVAANKELRARLKHNVEEKLPGIFYHEPPLEFTTDNAAMIGAAAYICLKTKKAEAKKIKNNWKNLKAESNLKIG